MNLYIATLYIPLFGLLFTPFLKGIYDRASLVILVLSEAVLLGLKSKGHDYLSYLDYFDSIQKAASLDEVLELVKDPLLYFIVKFLFVFSASSELIFFTIAVVSLSAIAIAIPSSVKHKSLVFCLFILFFGAGLYYEAIRAGLGVAFFYLCIRFKGGRWSGMFSIFSVASHISLAVPVIASFNWLSKIIARNLILSCLFFISLSNLIPVLLFVDERVSWYVNVEDKGTSRVAIVTLILFLSYLWTTRGRYSESDSRLSLISSALVTFFLGAIFSTYSEIAASRLDELGSAILFLLVVNDVADKTVIKIPWYKKIARWAIIISLVLVNAYVWYIRFILDSII